LTEDYAALQKFLNNLHNENQDSPMLILAFDEVQELTKRKVLLNGNSFVPSHILGQVIKTYSDTYVRGPAIWAVFTSRNSKITHFAAPAPIRKFKS
jgi:hypothetical protein